MHTYQIRRYYTAPGGMVIDTRTADFDTLPPALRYLVEIRGTIERQSDSSFAGLYVNGRAVAVTASGTVDPIGLRRAWNP